MKIKDIEKEVRKEYPLNYYREAIEAIVDGELQTTWLKTKEAQELNGNEACEKQIEELAKQIKKAKVKVEFIKSYYELQ